MQKEDTDTFTLSAVGDAIITRKISPIQEPRIKRIFETTRTTDASFVNLEVPIHDYEGDPIANRGGSYMRGPPWVADELSAAGFNLFAATNNHVGDYGQSGMERTIRELESRGIAYAGLGRNLAEAREPAYVDTAAGRVGLVAAATTVVPGTQAGDQRPDMPGRSGLSELPLRSHYVLPEDDIRTLVEIAERLELPTIGANRTGYVPELKENEDLDLETENARFHLLDLDSGTAGSAITFERGEESGIQQKVSLEDANAIHSQISRSHQQAEWTVASLHSHEGENAVYNDNTVPAFLKSFARECIDAGADVFVSHGTHCLRGIEVYRGAPIFYGLGNFLYQSDAFDRLPAEVYDRYGLDAEATVADVYSQKGNSLKKQRRDESVLPVVEWDHGEFVRAVLYPLQLRSDPNSPYYGAPQLATDEHAASIISRLVALSNDYDGEITFDGDETVGILSPE